MRNFAKLLGIIAMVAVIGFSMTACGEEEEGGIVRFDSALYGTWRGDSGSTAITFKTETDGDWVFNLGSTLDVGYLLTAKNGNKYTVANTVFTAVIGSDGKLTISSDAAWVRSGTYTKEQD